jgi:hypothetical protein
MPAGSYREKIENSELGQHFGVRYHQLFPAKCAKKRKDEFIQCQGHFSI